MLSKKTREAIGKLDFKIVQIYLENLGWHRNHTAKDGSYSLWYRDNWSPEEIEKLNAIKRVDEVEVMLPHKPEYRDYSTVMLSLFENLSIVYDKCECELLRHIDPRPLPY